MKCRTHSRLQSPLIAAVVLASALFGVSRARGQQSAANPAVSTAGKSYLVEWVYKVKWGYADEFWQLFKKYQIATLNREKELGYVKSYTVYRPGYHTGEDTRWEFRIVIEYKNIASSVHGSEVEKLLFPDHEAMRRGENRRCVRAVR